MSIELTPLGVKCQLACSYCYQTSLRDASQNASQPYDLTSMKRAAEAEGVGRRNSQAEKIAGKPVITGFTIFGGEPLMLPIADFEELCRWAREDKHTSAGIQTNGALITDRHFAIFKRYGVHVGVSVDGPGDLNRTRWAGSTAATDATTARTQANLERCLREGIATSVIVTVSNGNAGTDEALDRLIAWLDDLRALGLKHVNFHTLETDTPQSKGLALDEARSIAVMRRLRVATKAFVSVAPFTDMRRALLQQPGSNCVWNFCDPLTTNAVRGIGGLGQRKNCGRTEKQGVGFMKAQTPGRERQRALYLTPQEYGGCAECRFFAVCGGHCPGEGIDGDWRNRSRECGLIKALYTDLEQDLFAEGLVPLSQSPLRAQAEANILAGGAREGRTVCRSGQHGDRPHGDHGDHGDHMDAGRAR